MNEFETFGVSDIARIIHKTVDSVYSDVIRAPQTLPPRLKIPGSKKLLWLKSDVKRWLESCRAAAPAPAPVEAEMPAAPAIKRGRGRPTKSEQLARGAK